MLRLKDGESVKIIERAVLPADLKSGLYYNYYRNLSGTVFKIYGSGETAQIAIEVDLESLPEEIAKRHIEVRDQMRSNLTGEAKRQSAPGGEQEFRLRYVILVSANDVTRRTLPKNSRNGHIPTSPLPV